MELANIIVSGILGLAVIALTFISLNQNKKSIEHEKKMRALEIKVSTFELIQEVYFFFTCDLANPDFFNFEELFINFNNSFTRLTKLGFLIDFLFDNDLKYKLKCKISSIQQVLLNKEFPSFDINQIDEGIKNLLISPIESHQRQAVFLYEINKDIVELFNPYKLNLK